MITLNGSSTTGDLLFEPGNGDPGEGLIAVVAPSLEGRLPGGLAGAVRQGVLRDVADAVAGLADLELTDVLASGWQKHSQLRAAGRRTRQALGSQETVVLAEHRIAYEADPYVDVILGEAHLTRVTVTLEVTVDVTGLTASVRDGRLVALRSGRALLEATLAVAGTPPVRRGREIDLALEVGLGEGLRLA